MHQTSAQRAAQHQTAHTEKWGGKVSEATIANQCYLQMKRMTSQMKKIEAQI